MEAVYYICEILNRQLDAESVAQLMQVSQKLVTPTVSMLLPYMIFMDSKLGRSDLSSTYVRTLASAALTLLELLDDVELSELIRYNKSCRDCISFVEKSLGIKMDFDPLQNITPHQRELVRYATMAGEMVNENESKGVNTVADIIKRTSQRLGSVPSEKNTNRFTENEEDKLRNSNESEEETLIDVLDLPPSAQFRLKRVGVKTIESLYTISVKELKSFRCFGRKEFYALLDTLNEDYLRRYGSCSVRVKSHVLTGIPIEKLELSVRSYNCLKRAKISTVEELLEKTVEDLIHVRNLGRKCAEEVVDKVKGFLYSDEWNRLKGKMPEKSLFVDNNALERSIDELDPVLLDRGIDWLDIEVKTLLSLRNAGINKIGDLCRMMAYEVMSIRNLKPIEVVQIETALKKYNLSFMKL